MELSKVQVCNTHELKEKYWFLKEGHLPNVKDTQANQDMKTGFYVQCPPDENPDSKFKANLYITGLKDCPGACEIVKDEILYDIQSSQDCLEGAGVENWSVYIDELNEAKKSLTTDTVFKAIPQSKVVISNNKIKSGNKSEL